MLAGNPVFFGRDENAVKNARLIGTLIRA